MDWKSHILPDEALELERCKEDETRISDVRRKIRKRAWARAIKAEKVAAANPGAAQQGE